MRNIFVAFICAFIVTAAALNTNKRIQNKKPPKVVAIEDNGENICTGVMLFDGTILTMSNCFVSYLPQKHNLTIKFPNDKKSYKASFKYTSEEKTQKYNLTQYFEILALDEKDNPPKSEWTFQVLKSDRSGGKGQMIVIRKNKDKYETKVIDLTIEKCHVEDPTTYSFSSSFCSKGEVAMETDFVDQGAPLLFDGILAGTIITPGYPGRPIIFENFFSDAGSLENLLKVSSGNKKHEKKGNTPH